MPYPCSPQLWAFIMAATSIIVESSGLAFCHISAPSLPAQSVPNKCATGSRPSSFCPPQRWYEVDSTSPPPRRIPLPACLISLVYCHNFSLLTFPCGQTKLLWPRLFPVQPRETQTVYKCMEMPSEMTTRILILVPRLAFSEIAAQDYR